MTRISIKRWFLSFSLLITDFAPIVNKIISNMVKLHVIYKLHFTRDNIFEANSFSELVNFESEKGREIFPCLLKIKYLKYEPY